MCVCVCVSVCARKLVCECTLIWCIDSQGSIFSHLARGLCYYIVSRSAVLLNVCVCVCVWERVVCCLCNVVRLESIIKLLFYSLCEKGYMFLFFGCSRLLVCVVCIFVSVCVPDIYLWISWYGFIFMSGSVLCSNVVIHVPPCGWLYASTHGLVCMECQYMGVVCVCVFMTLSETLCVYTYKEYRQHIHPPFPSQLDRKSVV